jgi:hypothetical protein
MILRSSVPNSTMHYMSTSTVSDYAELLFTGTQFMLTFMKDFNRGLIDIDVIGVKIDTINANGTTIGSQAT